MTNLALAFALGVHRPFRGLETIEMPPLTPTRLAAIIERRIEHVRRGAGPTFATVDNDLEWIVRINQGMRWPTWQREYPITVLPSPVAVEENGAPATGHSGERTLMEYDDDIQVARMARWYQPDLLTPFERSVFVASLFRSKWSNNKTLEDRARKDAGTLGDSRIDEILDGDIDGFVRGVGVRLLREHADKLVLNRCPKCDRVTRTPQARQCFWCHHDWH